MDADDERFDRWHAWKTARPESEYLHLDTAASGRSSLAVLAAVSDHAMSEARVGAYVAEAETARTLSEGRARIATLLGMPAEGVAFVESASAGLLTLLAVWPFGPDATIAVAPSEWGPNLSALASQGLHLVELTVDDGGHVDLTSLTRLLSSAPPSAVHVTQVASHRPLVQPVAEMATACREAGVPLFVDAAQALGHVDTASGADVIYATSRKWLTGPRGVGVLAVAAQWSDALRPVLLARRPETDGEPLGTMLGSREAHVAGRVGLGLAAREHLELGASAVRDRLAAIGRATRGTLCDLGDWQVIGAVDEPSAITTLMPTAGQDVLRVRARLLEHHGIVTSAQQTFRAPRDMISPTLRVSPHVDCTEDDLLRLWAALDSL